MEQLQRKPIMRIEMTVKTNTTKRQTDKPDVFGVGMKTVEGSLYVGGKEASGTLSIKAEDDVLHYNLPEGEHLVVEIYSKHRSAPQPQDRSQQTPLSQNVADKIEETIASAELLSVHQPSREPEPFQQSDAFAETPMGSEEEQPTEEAPTETAADVAVKGA